MNKFFNLEEKMNRNLFVNDIPVKKAEDDQFNFKNNKVKEVFDLINDAEIRAITVAITGEWGSGKTSLINLLCEEIEKNNQNVLIKFEPLLESDLSIQNMVEIFLLKLLGRFKPGRNKIKKILKGLSIGVPSNVGLKCGPFSIGYNLEKKVKTIIEMRKEDTFDKQITSLNELLEKEKKRLFIIIDEIDRLPAKDVINFLMFTRVLECLTNHICIIGIDYKHTLEKLIAEGCLGLITYDIAKQYLDKFFQARFLVKINNHSAVSYIQKKLEILDNKVFSKYLDLANKQPNEDLLKIANYLSNIRQIKKWLVSIKINYPLLKYLKNDEKNYFIKFLAASIKHSIFIDNLNNHVIDKLINDRLKKENYLVRKYGVSPRFNIPAGADPTDENAAMDAQVDFEYDIIAALLGIKVHDKNFGTLSKKITQYPIDENFRNFSSEFLFNASPYLMILFLEGYGDPKKISIYDDYFENNIDDAIDTFVASEEEYMGIVVSDITCRVLVEEALPKKSASIDKLNAFLYKSNIRNQNRKYFLLFSMCKTDVAKVLEEGDVYLSTILLEIILVIFKPFNKEKLEPKWEGVNVFLKDLKYKKNDIKLFKPEEFRTILEKEIFPLWLDKFEGLFKSSESLFSQVNLLFIINKYIDWGNLMNHNNSYEEKFSSLFYEYMTNNNLEDIQITIENIIEESIEYTEENINEMKIFTNKGFYEIINNYLNNKDLKNKEKFLNLF
jgi:hypothetical protein